MTVHSLKLHEMPDPIEQFLQENALDETIKDLFEATEENVDLRTDLINAELVLFNKIFINNSFLFQRLNYDVYDEFLDKFARLKVSLDRKSRGEFVDINRKDRFEQNLKRFGDFSNLTKVKE